jgi:ubiquinone/menaquinone biosynthesis C-methylase UbiE
MQSLTSVNDIPSSKDYLEWDIYTWGNALKEWRKILTEKNLKNCTALEIGSKNGGLSLFLAKEFNCNVICSDITVPNEKAKALHKQFAVDDKINYSIQDVLKLEYTNDFFDIVIFKSVLGSVGKNENIEKQFTAIKEMHRVLKPGGILLFAENAKASLVHKMFRKIFRKWSEYWRYISIYEMRNMLLVFNEKKIFASGFLSVFASNDSFKKFLFKTDSILEKFISKNSMYVIYGYAIK